MAEKEVGTLAIASLGRWRCRAPRQRDARPPPPPFTRGEGGGVGGRPSFRGLRLWRDDGPTGPDVSGVRPTLSAE